MSRPHGDYTGLARDYARYRAGYAPSLPTALIELAGGASKRTLDVVDVGAGTGIWTRMIAARACRTIAIEPNDEMRELGRQAESEVPIDWRSGAAEHTGLAADACDLLTMASSFHWTDFDRATAEFKRVLRPGGVFAALWNTRVIEANPLLVEIEAELHRRVPNLDRVSSGRSAFCEGLHDRLEATGHFTDVAYLEDCHVEAMSPGRYLGLWRSVNDVRVQSDERVFAEFLSWVTDRTKHLEAIEATYLTRAWTARTPIAEGSP